MSVSKDKTSISSRPQAHLDSGSIVLETAIVLPLLIMLVFGVIQWGVIIYSSIALNNAAYNAARYSVLSPTPVNAQVQAVADSSLGTMMDSSNLHHPIMIDQNYNVGGIAGATKVQLVYDLPLFAPFVVPGSNGGSYTITANSVMR